jgi:hypothetical protein
MGAALRCTPSGHLTDREWLWATMRELETFTLRELCRAVNIGRDTVITHGKAGDYLRGLVRAGIVTQTETGRLAEAHQYTLTKDMGVRAPRVRKDGSLLPDSGRNRMWKAMQVLGRFSVRELMHAASLDDAPVAYNEAKTYCQWLARGGYLLRSGGERFAFVRARHTGPKAPQILRVKVLYDPNTGADVVATTPEGRDDL